PVEIQAAEIIGKRLFQDFDSVSFREVFEHLDELPSFESVAAVLDGGLETGDKKRLLAFLLEIAAADGEISVEERALLNGAAARWNVSRPIELRLPAGRRRRRAARAEKAPKEPPAAAEERALGEGAERGDPAPLGAAKPNS
ncbi:MAG: TerB family tellurite resistance protein, partial [Pseudomonadota bacterium]